MQNFTIVSNFDALELHGFLLRPTTAPKAVVVMVHGMCEKKERYLPLARFFENNGYAVAVYDQRGHGESVKTKEDLGFFGDKNAVAVVEDLLQVVQYLKGEFPETPVYMFGHSMGSMIVRCFLQEHDDAIDKLIVCGSPSGNPLAGIARYLAKLIGLFRGDHYRSKLLVTLSTGTGDDNFPGEPKGCWLSKNKENVAEFYADPDCNFRFTCNGFENLFSMMQKTYQKRRYKVKNPSLPIFFTSGSDDAVLVSEDKWLSAQADLREVGYENVSGKLYHGYRHEIHNEIENDVVYADFLAFFEND